MRVLAHDPYVAPDRFRDLGVEQAESLQELLAASDFVSLHLTLTADTHNIIGRDQLEAAGTVFAWSTSHAASSSTRTRSSTRFAPASWPVRPSTCFRKNRTAARCWHSTASSRRTSARRRRRRRTVPA